MVHIDERERQPRLSRSASPVSVHIGIVGEMHASAGSETCISPTIRKWTVSRAGQASLNALWATFSAL